MEPSIMKPGEFKVIRISKSALRELVWEIMNENVDEYFDLQESDNTILKMKWNDETDEVTCVACCISDFDRIDIDKIENRVGVTVRSLFSEPRYKKLQLELD